MSRLLKLQLFRALKDKGTIVFSIITIVLGIFSVLLNYVISINLSGMGTLVDDLFDIVALVNSSFSLTSTPMILLIIVGVVLLYKESGWGTIRNQVVAGYSKVKIYFANFFSMLIILFTILLAYQLVVTGFGLVLGFDFGVSSAAEWGVFFRKYGLNLLIFISEIAFMTFISMLFQNIIAPIFLVIIVPIFIGAILVNFVIPLVVLFNQDNAAEIVGIFEYIIWYQNTALTISGFSYQLMDQVGDLFGTVLYDTSSTSFILKTIGTSVALNGLFLGVGSLLFARKDLK
ncbi:MAG: hypothetical protein EOM77_00680 [Bacteroidia bacterium]|nr:hypothetical protein [Bacteroidia bacterium]